MAGKDQIASINDNSPAHISAILSFILLFSSHKGVRPCMQVGFTVESYIWLPDWVAKFQSSQSIIRRK